MFGYLILIATCSLGFISITYKGYALSRGWPIGKILSNELSTIRLASLVAMVWALFRSVILFEWHSFLVVLICGFILAYLLSVAFKKNVQLIVIFGTFPAFILTILYRPEKSFFYFITELF
ncbi:MAG: hypothetical protein RIC90_13135 [Balneola sp.]